jgi:hypothetical protein
MADVGLETWQSPRHHANILQPQEIQFFAAAQKVG